MSLKQPSDYERSLLPKDTSEYLEGLESALEEARAELDAIKARMGETPKLESLHMEGGVVELVASHPVLAFIANELYLLLKEAGGTNYVEFTVNHKEQGEFTLLLQRKEGKTPAELNLELKAELANKTELANNLLGKCNEYRDTIQRLECLQITNASMARELAELRGRTCGNCGSKCDWPDVYGVNICSQWTPKQEPS